MFFSEVFARTFANATRVPLEIFETDGSRGAAMGAAIGAGIFKNAKEAFSVSKSS